MQFYVISIYARFYGECVTTLLGGIMSHLRLDIFKRDSLLISWTSIKIWFITLPITGHICSCAYKLQLQTIAESAFIAPFLHPRLHPIFYKMDQKSYKYKEELPNNYRALQKKLNLQIGDRLQCKNVVSYILYEIGCMQLFSNIYCSIYVCDARM